MLLNNQWIKKEIKREVKQNLETNESGNTFIHRMSTLTGWSKSNSKKEFRSNTGLCQETRKIYSKQPNFTPQGTRKRRTRARVSGKKEITKIKAEINKIETKKTIDMVYET